MFKKPKRIIVTGRPGSGKTTLAGELCRKMYLPKTVNEVFFETILNLLKGNVSVVIEAAFQHKLWNRIVPRINEIALAYIVVCDLNAELSARRHLERGLADPRREFYHGDKRVTVFRETGKFEAGGKYIPPHYDVPTLRVSTVDGYAPGLDTIVEFVHSQHTAQRRGPKSQPR